MKSLIYTAWNGTQSPFNLKRQDIIKAFMDNIMEGMDPNMAIAQMLWEGFPLAGKDFRVMGSQEMPEQLQKKREELFSLYSLEKAFDVPLHALRSLLENEAQTREEKGISKSPLCENLSPGLLEKMRSLKDFPFLNDESRETFEEWKERESDIQELLEFYSQWGHHFKGKTFLDFEEALELMRQFKSIEKMEQQIRAGQWTQIDPETLRELLGDEASRSMAILLTVPGQLSREELVQFGKKGFDLTPRGIRSSAEMAFGDLYHMVKRDRQGSYQGNAPQSGEIEPDSSRPFTFGDRFDLDITRTMLKSVLRNPSMDGRLKLTPEDFYVR